MCKIKVYGTSWCRDCKRVKRIFEEHQVEYLWIDINKDLEGEAFVKSTNHGNRSVPTIVFPDEDILVEPTNQKLIKKLEDLCI